MVLAGLSRIRRSTESQMRVAFLAVAATVVVAAPAAAQAFNGAPDNQVDNLDYYYVLSGGKFPNGQTRNGDIASGGTMRFITDDPIWGFPLDIWQKDSWFTENSGIALTMKNGATIVYDNNGIETGTYGSFYTEGGDNAGLVRAYSMPNNYDWTYAGLFQLSGPTTFTQLIGYFDGNGYYNDGSFNPANFRYQMNIWSETGDLPTNTGSFLGDVFTTATAGGTFTYSYTGVDRVFTTNNIYPAGTRDPIWRMVWTADAPVTLQAGDYYYANDALVGAVTPEPGTMSLLGIGLVALVGAQRRKRST